MRRKYRVSARLCLAPRISSSPPPPFLRRFPPLLLRGTMRNSMPWNDHDDSPFLQIHFRFVIAIEFFTSAQFFWDTFIEGTYLYLLIGVPSTSCPQFSLVSFSRATSCFWFFRIPGAKRHFADTAAKRIVSRPRWMSCEITVGIPCLLRTRLKLLLPGEQILSKLVSLYCYLSTKENFFGMTNASNERMDPFRFR